MADLPAQGDITAAATIADLQSEFEDLRDVISQLQGDASTTRDLTIATGVITPVLDTGGMVNVLPESGTSDDLVTVTATNHANNSLIMLRNKNAANTITLKHNSSGADHLRLANSADYAMPGDRGWILFQYDTTSPGYWVEINRRIDPNSLLVDSDGNVDLGVSTTWKEQSATPANPTADTEFRMYMRADKIIFQFNDGGTVRYKSLDLTGTGVTWVHSTTAPT